MTLLYSHPLFQQHLTGGHPEHPRRLAAIEAQLQQRGLTARCTQPTWQPATSEQLERLHEPPYI